MIKVPRCQYFITSGPIPAPDFVTATDTAAITTGIHQAPIMAGIITMEMAIPECILKDIWGRICVDNDRFFVGERGPGTWGESVDRGEMMEN